MGPASVAADARLIIGDVIDSLGTLAPNSVHTVITSPPYYGLRSYGIPARTWDDGQHCVLGDEQTVTDYVRHLVIVCREIRRVLREDGTFWLNLGDSYAGGGIHSEPIKYPGVNKPNRPRQKYANYTIASGEDRAWLAALIDGEGCIQIHRQTREDAQNCFQVDVGVGMMTKGMIQHAHEITGLGSVNRQARGVWDWSVRGQQAAALLREIYPRLILKRRQAALACMLADDLATRNLHRTRPLTQDVINWRQSIKQAVSDLNQRKEPSVDAPAPPPIIGMGHKLTSKDLLMVPARVAIALQEDGWILRSDVIWAKGVSFCRSYSGSVMPESTRDRPTWGHEHVFLLTKGVRYYYDIDGAREPYATMRGERPYRGQGVKPYADAGVQNPSDTKRRVQLAMAAGAGRNLRNVWLIGKGAGTRAAHFATFSPALVAPMVQLGTSDKGCCPDCGAQLVRQVMREAVPDAVQAKFEASRAATAASTGRTDGHTGSKPNYVRRVIGTSWAAGCGCQFVDGVPSTVMDPFSGSATTGVVAGRMGRSYIGIDVSEPYTRDIAAVALPHARIEVIVGTGHVDQSHDPAEPRLPFEEVECPPAA